jgi:putative transposase
MKKQRFSDEPIIGFLKQAESGAPVKEVCRANGFGSASFYKCCGRFGGIDASDARRSIARHIELSIWRDPTR